MKKENSKNSCSVFNGSRSFLKRGRRPPRCRSLTAVFLFSLLLSVVRQQPALLPADSDFPYRKKSHSYDAASLGCFRADERWIPPSAPALSFLLLFFQSLRHGRPFYLQKPFCKGTCLPIQHVQTTRSRRFSADICLHHTPFFYAHVIMDGKVFALKECHVCDHACIPIVVCTFSTILQGSNTAAAPDGRKDVAALRAPGEHIGFCIVEIFAVHRPVRIIRSRCDRLTAMRTFFLPDRICASFSSGLFPPLISSSASKPPSFRNLL